MTKTVDTNTRRAAQPDSPVLPDDAKIESTAILAAVMSGVLALGVTVIILYGDLAPLTGWNSVVIVAMPVVGLTSGISFLWAYIRHADGGVRWRARHPVRRVLDVFGLTLTATGVAVLLIASMFQVFSLAFLGLSLNWWASAALVGALAAACAYTLAIIAGHLTTSTLATLLTLFLVAGVFTSMLTAENPAWWHNNFSALGMGMAVSSFAFNLTILIAGLVILTLSDYLTIDLLARRSRPGRRFGGVQFIRMALAIVGVALIGLGLVPVDINVPIHNTFSISALLGFSVLIVLAPILLRGTSPAFLVFTIVFGALIVIGAVLFIIGYYNLTALELIAVVVIFAWLIVFTRTASLGRASTPHVEATTTVFTQPRARSRGALIATGVVVAFLVGRLSRRPRTKH